MFEAENDLLVFVLSIKALFGGSLTADSPELGGLGYGKSRRVTLNIGEDGLYLTVIQHPNHLGGPMLEIIYESNDSRYNPEQDAAYMIEEVKGWMAVDGYHIP